MNREQAAAYDVLVDGASIDQEHKDRIKEIRIVDYVRLPDVCTVTVTYPRTEGIDSQPFEIGKELEVQLGAIGKIAPQTLFKGQVVTLEPEFGTGGCGLTVRAFDKAHVLLRSRHVRTFQNQTSSDIVSKIVGEAGLSAKVDSSGDPHEFLQQDNETDWDFIWRLAERVGFELVAAGSEIRFCKPASESTVELEWPETLRSFSPRVTAVQQVNEVTLFAHDPMTKQVIEASASTPEQIAQIGISRDEVTTAFQESKVHVATEPVWSRNEGTALAQALLDKLANGYVAAEGFGPGNPKIKAGVKVRVAGVGAKFSGIYRVATSTHILRAGGYVTQFANSPTHTILGATGGGNGGGSPHFSDQLVLGIVTNNNDPEELGRVRVSYPALGQDTESAWARVAWPSAGKERGLMMLPVVGEEVLLAFEGNTTRPYVLGSLFNGKDTPGDDLLQKNDGTFALRSDKRIYAESKEDFTQKSGGKLIVEIQGKVEEKFQQDWSNQTTGKVSLKAGQPFEIEGQSVSIKGNTQVSIEGTATVSLKCGASEIQLSPAGVKISGPIINIG
jgi:uncharacterized protein involved in type VI secretion and phage assembly